MDLGGELSDEVVPVAKKKTRRKEGREGRGQRTEAHELVLSRIRQKFSSKDSQPRPSLSGSARNEQEKRSKENRRQKRIPKHRGELDFFRPPFGFARRTNVDSLGKSLDHIITLDEEIHTLDPFLSSEGRRHVQGQGLRA